jgi:hypothetical protein
MTVTSADPLPTIRVQIRKENKREPLTSSIESSAEKGRGRGAEEEERK